MVAKNAGHVLYGIFKKKFKEAHANKPPALREYSGNAYRDAAMLKRVAEDVGEDVLLDIMDWYFEHRSVHEVKELVFNYDAFLREMDAREREARHLAKVQELTRRRVEEMGIEL